MLAAALLCVIVTSYAKIKCVLTHWRDPINFVFKLVNFVLFMLALGGCMAITTSPIGVNCGPSAEKPIWDRPLDFQGR